MADNIKESTRPIAKLPTRLAVNTDTGAAILYVDGGVFGRDPVAEASTLGDNWTINDDFVRRYNNRNGASLSKQELQKVFKDQYQKTLNNDRANLINTHSPYNTKIYLKNTAKIPGVIDPKTGLKTGDTRKTPPKASEELKFPDPPPNFNLEISQETTTVEITTTPITLRYPLNNDTKNNNYDFLKIQVAKYVPGLSGGLQEGTNLAIQSVKARITEKGTSVILPMYPGISESNSVSWGSDELNPIQAAFGAAAYNIINQFGSENFDFGKALQNAGNQLGAAVKNLANTPELQQYISAYFAGQAVGANILGRTTGMVVNPNLELLFKGPQLRSFKYSYRFTPRDNKEAKEIRRIIKFFKREMAVQKNDNNVFLKTPNVFFLDYIFRGTETNVHPFLNKIKPCALTSFNVNYTPDGTYMTYHDGTGEANGSMTSYTVDMQFDELEPIYRDDHSDSLDDPTMGF